MSNQSIKINEKTDGLCGYIGFDHKGRQYELFAKNSWDAIELLRKTAKPPKSEKFKCSVHIAMREDGTTILHSTAF